MNRLVETLFKKKLPADALLLGAGLVAGLFALLGLFASWSWLCDIFQNFVPQYALGLSFCVAALLLMKKWRFAALLAPLLALCVVETAPLYFPAKARTAQPGARSYKLVAYNVLSSNKEVESMLRFLERENPDFIILTEYTEKWNDAAAELSKKYPLRILEPHSDNFGIAIFGRYAGEPKLARTDDEFGLPTHSADFALPDGRNLKLLGVHAILPAGKLLSEEREKCLLQCARICRAHQAPAIIAGDFNMSPFSPFYKKILQEGDMTSATQGLGLCPTWPSWDFWPLKPFSMEIDNCLVSKDVRVLSWKTGPELGSDHLPVVVEFALD